jgi:hypothetical protein
MLKSYLGRLDRQFEQQMKERNFTIVAHMVDFYEQLTITVILHLLLFRSMVEADKKLRGASKHSFGTYKELKQIKTLVSSVMVLDQEPFSSLKGRVDYDAIADQAHHLINMAESAEQFDRFLNDDITTMCSELSIECYERHHRYALITERLNADVTAWLGELVHTTLVQIMPKKDFQRFHVKFQIVHRKFQDMVFKTLMTLQAKEAKEKAVSATTTTPKAKNKKKRHAKKR